MSAVLFEQAVADAGATARARGDRQAALLLHGMDAASRRWALERLQPQERARVEPLLGELAAMGVPADAPWLHGIADRAASEQAEFARGQPRQRIDAASVADLMPILDGEPRELVRRLLALGPWRWQGELARSFAIATPVEPLSGGRLADEALLIALAARLPAPQPGHRERAGRGIRGWLARVRPLRNLLR